jgi:hypothetical protein
MMHQQRGDVPSYVNSRSIPFQLLPFVVALFSVMLFGCGSSSELPSSWRSKDVVIDGVATEWGPYLTNLKDTHVSLGVQNDQNFMYVCLMSSDEQFRRQLLARGFTLWFEGEDGKIGVHYPIGFVKQGGPPARDESEAERERIDNLSPTEMEILGPGKDDRNLFSILEAPGINVKLGAPDGPFVYELKIPLRKSNAQAYAVGAGVASTVKLTLETGKFEEGSRPRGGMGEGTRGGGMRPRGGGQRGGRMPTGEGSGGGATRGSRPEPLNVSATVRLATQGPTTTQ